MMNRIIINRKNGTINNIVLSFIGLIINYGINFALTPYILQQLGGEAYGFVSLSSTMVNYLIIITGALNSYACNCISYEYHRKDFERAKGFYNSLFVSNFILILGILGLGSIFIININLFLNISNLLLFDVKIIFSLVLINYSLNIFGTPYTIAVFIQNRLDLSSVCSICAYLINAVGVVILFLFYVPKIWYMALMAIVVSIFTIACNLIFTKKLTPELKINHKLYSNSYVFELLKLGLWSSLGRVGLILSDGLDLLITNLLMNGIVMGQVSLAKVIPAMAYSIIYQLSINFQPTQVMIWAEKRKELLINNLKMSMKVMGVLSNIIFCGFISVGLDFLKLWIPTENIEFIYKLTIFGMIGNVSVAVVFPLIYTNALTKRLKAPCIVNIACGFLNVFFMYILLNNTNYGAYIIVGTSAILSLIVHFVFIPINSTNNIKVSWYIFYPTIIKSFFVLILTYVIFLFLGGFFQVKNWFDLIIKALFLAIIGFVINFMLITNRNEKNITLTFFFEKIRGIRGKG